MLILEQLDAFYTSDIGANVIRQHAQRVDDRDVPAEHCQGRPRHVRLGTTSFWTEESCPVTANLVVLWS